MSFCPFTRDECREDCALVDIQYTLEEDGIESELFCAFAIIAGYILGQVEE